MNLRAIRLLLIALLIAEATLWFFGPQVKDHMLDVAAGHRPDWWDDAALGIHFAAEINAVLFLVLLGTAQWWSRSIADRGLRIADSNDPASPTEASTNPKSEIRSRAERDRQPEAARRAREESRVNPQFFWPSLIIAVLACLALRLPLASKSLWWDEAWVIEQVSFGRWKPDPKQPDAVKFQPLDWARCAWYYQKPTNHAPMSLLQKASITAWQKMTHAKRSEFSDLSARIPALLASCLAVILLGLLLREWGHPGAGAAAAFVLAIHPWYIRYGVDARAYALVVPLCIGGMLAITRILQSRGARFLPWLSWGIVEFLWLWAFPNAVLDVAALNLVAAFLLWKQHAGKDRGTALFRLAATNVFAAICLIQVFLPNLMQARHWAGQEPDKHVLDADLVASTIWQLLWGYDAGLPIAPKLVVIGASLVLLVGALELLWKLTHRRSLGESTIILSALLASSLAFAGTTWMLGSYFYPRFIIALLPVLIAMSCLGRSSTGALPRMHWIIGNFLATVVFLALCPFQLYLTCPYEPLHDVASFVQTDSAKQSKPPLVACYGLGREVMPVYDPACIPVENAAGVSRLLERSHEENRALYVLYGYNAFNRTKLADGFKLLDDPTRFTELKVFPGIESEFYFHVLKGLQ